MFRSCFFAIGIFLLVLGVQSLVVDKVVMANRSQSSNAGNINLGQRVNQTRFGINRPFQTAGYQGASQSYYSRAGVPALTGGRKRIYQTKDWMPWSLLAAGTVVVVYTYSLGGGGSEG